MALYPGILPSVTPCFQEILQIQLNPSITQYSCAGCGWIMEFAGVRKLNSWASLLSPFWRGDSPPTKRVTSDVIITRKSRENNGLITLQTRVGLITCLKHRWIPYTAATRLIQRDIGFFGRMTRISSTQ